MPQSTFHCKQFSIRQDKTAMKVGTDGLILGSWVEVESGDQVLDIGSGTGLLALMVAQKGAGHVDAVEVDKAAAEQAQQNGADSSWRDRITVYHQAIQDFQPATSKYDLIVSNPPFFDSGNVIGNPAREMARQDSGLPIGDLADSMIRLLAPTGRAVVILPIERKQQLEESMGVAGFFAHKILSVQPTPNKRAHRVVLEFRKGFPRQVAESDLTIRESNRYSEAYQKLTGDFYHRYP